MHTMPLPSDPSATTRRRNGIGGLGKAKEALLLNYTWLATLMRNRNRSDNGMIFARDVHMAAKVANLDDPPQVCSLQLTKSK